MERTWLNCGSSFMTSRGLTIRFDTPLHHGNGYGMAGIVDRPFLQDGNGLPYLAGSAIKGKFRYAAARLVTTLGSESICGQVAGQFCRPSESEGTGPCVLCRLFGSPWRGGSLVFTDARPVAEEASLLRQLAPADKGRAHGTTIRATTAIDRRLRIVRAKHLFTTEVAPALSFEGRIEGDLTPADEQLLRHCTMLLTHFGADSARGLGQCRFEIRHQTSQGDNRSEP
ncbi:MAG: hypothetical protein HY235_28460 [Acidobacteria bacterium]|nr:hypothetical protein [Acidobacteriota bacterium]